jgi:membrane protein DedA with SNARE-associated domain
VEMALREAMTAIVQFIVRHGYPILFAAVFARQLGLPVPAPWFLLAAGALAASGKLGVVAALGLAVSGCVLADWIWYEAGRAWGERVLHFIHRFTPDPEAADRRSKKMFARHGVQLLVLDKFVPGLDAVVPPLAGTSGTARLRFLAFETVGASLWSSAYAGLGYVFSHDLDRAAAQVSRAGTWVTSVLVAALGIYAVCKLIRWRRPTGEVRVVRMTATNPKGSGLHQPSRTIEGVEHEY